MLTRVRITVVAAVVSGLAAVLSAQSPANAGRPAFIAASVKQDKAGGPTSPFAMGFLSGGRFTATNVTVERLISAAYGPHQLLSANRIIGGPSWLHVERFNIVAKTDDPDSTREIDGFPRRVLMLQSLLASRFKLAIHRETRVLPVYALTANKKLGPRMHLTKADCAALPADPGGAAIPPPPLPDQRPKCGIGFRGYTLIGGNATMSQLASALSTRVDRVVVDRTNLAGTYDLDLSWTPQVGPATAPTGASDPAVLISMLTALADQLGLKLEASTGSVDVYVIDHVERPTEN